MTKSSNKRKIPPEDDVTSDFVTPEEYQVAQATQIWSNDDTGHDLTVEEQLFCRSFIVDRNPIAAMRRLNYVFPPKQLEKMAQRHLSNPEVQGCIEVLAKRMMDNLQITADRVNEQIGAIAFADLRGVMRFDHTGVTLLHSKFWTKEQIAALQSVEMGQNGIKLKMYNRMEALKLLAQQLNIVDDEKQEQRRLAEAGAEAALRKIMDVAVRKRQDLPAPIDAEETIEGSVVESRSIQ